MSTTRSKFDQWGGFVAVGVALSLCFSVSSLPTPLYPIYQQHWGIPPSALSYIFTAYMLGVLPALICFGRLSDTLGRFRVVLLSLLMLSTGLFLSAVAQGVPLLLLARFIIGFGNGLLTTTGSVTLAEAHPEKNERAGALVTSMSISVAYGMGPVLSGALAQTGVAPLALSYLVVLALALVNIALLVRYRARLQGPFGKRAKLSIRPQLALPAPERRFAFLLACVSGFAVFSTGSLFASLAPSLLEASLSWKGPIVMGIAFLIIAATSTYIQLSQRATEPFKALALGLAGFAFSVALLVGGAASHQIGIVAASMVAAGVGQGYAFMGGAAIALLYADKHRRTANMSTYFLWSYAGATVPIVVIGLAADRVGLAAALYAYSAVDICLLLILGYLALGRHKAL